MRRVDLIFISAIVAALSVFGCSSLSDAADAIVARAGMPPDLQLTNTELAQRQNELAASEAHRKSVLAQAVVFGTENDKTVRNYLELVDRNIARLQSRIVKLETWKESLEAQTIQNRIDATTN